MKQGTIKTLGAIALGAVAVIAGGGTAAAVGNAPVGPAAPGGGAGQAKAVAGQGPAAPGQAPQAAPRPGQPGPNGKSLLDSLPLPANALKAGGLPLLG